MKTSRKFSRIGTVALGLAALLGAGCSTPSKPNIEPKRQIYTLDYTIEDLESVLKNRGYHFSEKQKNEWETQWAIEGEKDKVNRKIIKTREKVTIQALIILYTNLNSYYDLLSKKEKKEIDDLDLNKLPSKRIEESRIKFPWINIENPSLEDKFLMYIGDPSKLGLLILRTQGGCIR
ncbi:MAG: hypothetical protein AABX30_00865 [Nanoarchaeota archaeon]